MRSLDCPWCFLPILQESQRGWRDSARSVQMGVSGCCGAQSHRYPLPSSRLHLHRNVQAERRRHTHARTSVVSTFFPKAVSPYLTLSRMHYPSDRNTYAIQTQFFYGPALLINPVTQESSTSVSFYVPQGTWYDFATQKPVSGAGSTITYSDIDTSSIPILVSGGSIIPARVKSAMTTKELRDNDFELLVAPDAQGNASGTLYLDDGESLTQKGTSEIVFSWDGKKIKMAGTFGFSTNVGVKTITIMGDAPQKYELNEGLGDAWEHDVGDLKKL